MAACVPLAGCAEVEVEEATGYEPAKLEAVAGSDFKRVTFTEEGIRRVDLRTEAVRRVGGRLAVPHSSVLYGPDGATYVYVATGERSFLRGQVTVDRVDGRWALVSRGPAVGSAVVTTGAAQVYGAELEIAGSH
jgi:hypothetical protein